MHETIIRQFFSAWMKKNGAAILLEGIQENGINTIFGYPGGSVIPFYDTLLTYPQMHHILVRNEQGASFAAAGYSRSSGKVGVCLATSGPGATNLITGVADAMMDSIPMIVITGQVWSHLLGSDAFQEVDALGTMLPIVKHSYQVKNAGDMARVITEAFHIASTGRPGPVHIDITKNAFIEEVDFSGFPEINMPGYTPVLEAKDEQIHKAIEIITNAKNPVAIIGHGTLIAHAEKEALEFIEKLDIPCVQTLLGLSAVPTNHPKNLGMLGMHGQVYANYAVHDADVIISLGSRFDDRITGKIDDFERKAKFIHFDIDPAEVKKNVRCDAPVVGDLKKSLEKMLPLLPEKKHPEWNTQIQKWKEEFAPQKVHACHTERCKNDMRAWDVLTLLAEENKGNCHIVSDVGQHEMWIAQGFPVVKPNTHHYSGGAGTMGFSLPSAIGVQIANPDEEVWSFSGDGGIQMNIQELMTVVQEKIPLKIAVLNNNYLGMVRQWQELFESGYSYVDIQNPDFIKIGEAYGIPSFKAQTIAEAQEAIKKAREIDGPVFIEFMIAKEENVFPMVPQGLGLGDTRIE
jgi:acetolactate synthase-1/2/3 large subunit